MIFFCCLYALVELLWFGKMVLRDGDSPFFSFFLEMDWFWSQILMKGRFWLVGYSRSRDLDIVEVSKFVQNLNWGNMKIGIGRLVSVILFWVSFASICSGIWQVLFPGNEEYVIWYQVQLTRNLVFGLANLEFGILSS